MLITYGSAQRWHHKVMVPARERHLECSAHVKQRFEIYIEEEG